MTRLIAAMLLCNACAAHAAEMTVIGPELWDRPRSGKLVSEQPAVRQAVRAYLNEPGARLVIHHAPGQEPLTQAEELRAWLVALAIEADRVNLRGDLNRGEPLKIEVTQ